MCLNCDGSKQIQLKPYKKIESPHGIMSKNLQTILLGSFKLKNGGHSKESIEYTGYLIAKCEK